MLRQLCLVGEAPPWPAAPEQLQVALPGRRGAIQTIDPAAVTVAELSPSLKRAQQGACSSRRVRQLIQVNIEARRCTLTAAALSRTELARLAVCHGVAARVSWP